MKKFVRFSLWNHKSKSVYFFWSGFRVDGETDTCGGDTTHPRVGTCTVSSHFTPRSWNPAYLHWIPAFEGQWGWRPSVFSRVNLPGQAAWRTAPEVIPDPQPHALMSLSHPAPQCCHTTHSHGKTSPLIILAALSWIPPLRALFMGHHGRPRKGLAKPGRGQFSWKVNNVVHIRQSATPGLGLSP